MADPLIYSAGNNNTYNSLGTDDSLLFLGLSQRPN